MVSPMTRHRSLLTTGLASQIEGSITDLLSRSPLTTIHARLQSVGIEESTALAASAATIRNIHGILPLERLRLEFTTILYIGERHAAADGWIRTCQQYGSTVHVCNNIIDGHEFLLLQGGDRGRNIINSINSSTRPGLGPECIWSPQSPTSSLRVGINGGGNLQHVGIVILDLDSASISGSAIPSEEACAEILSGSVGPLRILCLFTKQYMVLTPNRASGGGVNADWEHAPNGSPPPRMESVSPTSADISSPTTAATSTASICSPPTSLIPSFADAPTPSLSVTSFSRLCDSSATVLSPNITSHESINRSLRKPFKIAAFLRAILKLRSATTTTIDMNAASSTDTSRNVTPEASWPVMNQASNESAATPSLPIDRRRFATSSSSVVPVSSSSRIAAASSSSSRSKITSIASSYPLRILLAEDNAMNQKLMVMLLRKLGYEIQIAANGREVLSMLDREFTRGRQHEIQCILMDASMDVMDDMECTRVIRAQQLPHRVRPFIIAQTANATDEYRTRCLESGMDLFTAKPVQVEALVSALQQAYKWQQQPLKEEE